MAACVNAVEGGGGGGGVGRLEKLPNSSALLIAEMQYDLFRNMQIQKSLCLVYQREPLIQSLGGGREGEAAQEQEQPARLLGRVSCKTGERRVRRGQTALAPSLAARPLTVFWCEWVRSFGLLSFQRSHVTSSSSQLESHASHASPDLLPASLALLCRIDFSRGGIAHVLAQVSPHSWRRRGEDTIIPSSSISEATLKDARLRKSISPGARVGAIFKLPLFFLSDPNNYALSDASFVTANDDTGSANKP